MPRTLLIGNPNVSWREWLKANRKGRDLMLLDPSDANHTAPCRLTLLHGEKVGASHFYGSLDPLRGPHHIVAALMEMLAVASADVLIQFYAYRPSPLLRQLTLLLAGLSKPDEIIIAAGTDIDRNALPVGPEEAKLEPAFPTVVQGAQRKAQWLKLLESCQAHEVNLRGVGIDGTRFGSGQRIERMDLLGLGLDDAVWVEVTGRSLLIVSEVEPEAHVIARAQDNFGCNRASLVDPSDYNGLLCSFAKASGEDFGMGMVKSIDFEASVAYILNSAEAPAPVRLLRLGSLRINESGSEFGEGRPWQI